MKSTIGTPNLVRPLPIAGRGVYPRAGELLDSQGASEVSHRRLRVVQFRPALAVFGIEKHRRGSRELEAGGFRRLGWLRCCEGFCKGEEADRDETGGTLFTDEKGVRLSRLDCRGSSSEWAVIWGDVVEDRGGAAGLGGTLGCGARLRCSAVGSGVVFCGGPGRCSLPRLKRRLVVTVATVTCGGVGQRQVENYIPKGCR
ncbi:hypothetical protein Droror1_Dr00023686 [Drosera rotundifolia]